MDVRPFARLLDPAEKVFEQSCRGGESVLEALVNSSKPVFVVKRIIITRTIEAVGVIEAQ